MDFFDNLRAVSQAAVSLLMAGKVSLREIEQRGGWVSPFSNITPAMRLREFTEAESVGFLSSCPGVLFTPEESKAILGFAERHPCKLQIGCYQVKLKREFGGGGDEALAEAEDEWGSIKPDVEEVRQ